MTPARRCTVQLAGALALAGVVGAPGFAPAQVNCDTMVGPARSDCYIGTARIQRQKSEIAATVARQRTDAANFYRVTRTRPKTMSAPKPLVD